MYLVGSRVQVAHDVDRFRTASNAARAAYIPPPPLTAGIGSNPVRAVAHEGRLHDALGRAEAQRQQLQVEEAAARRHLEDAAQPEGFGLALWVLGYIGVTAIAIPLALMVGSPLTLPLWARIVVAVGFLSGVALLLWYLAVYARYLHGQSDNSFPETLWGLLSWRKVSTRGASQGPEPGQSGSV